MNEKNIKVTKREHTFKSYASTCNVEILNYFNLELQLKDTDSVIKSKLIHLFSELKGIKFVKTLVLVFKKKEREDATKYDNFYSSSKVEININENDMDDVFQSIYTVITTKMQISFGKVSGLIIEVEVFQSIILQLGTVI